MPEKEFNEVSYPAHYVSHPSGIECIDVIEHMPANIAMAMKYLWRCDAKHEDPTIDLKKSIWFIEREIKRRSKERL